MRTTRNNIYDSQSLFSASGEDFSGGCGCSGADGNEAFMGSDGQLSSGMMAAALAITNSGNDDKFDFSQENLLRIFNKISSFVKNNPELLNKVKGYLGSNQFRQERIANCGRMPLKAIIDASEKKKYRTCVENFLNRRFQQEFSRPSSTGSGLGTTPRDPNSGKILGMSPITFAVVAVGVLGVSAYFIFRKK